MQESIPAQTAIDPARFARVQALFHAALEIPEQLRPSYLERACVGDAALLSDILGMLEEDAKGASLLDYGLARLASRFVGPANGDAARNVGPYRLIKPLGEGGMGMVYLAERDDLGNPVAIKFLRDAWLSPVRRERFAIEQRLLAPLNHPSIARLYDAGTLENGTPWFAMEYVEGVPLTEYCSLRQCGIEERLRLFRSVCGAVQYAHEHAVIHRDLKPSNILVKPDGGVRLLDFGIAKQISDFEGSAGRTQTALRMMTPAYAAPEQIRGEPVGVFTDVYALGIILYELLTGQPPFDLSKRTPGEAERLIVEAEPEKPSSACKSPDALHADRAEWADLDILCLTAIHKDVQRRYRSVEALIRDVDHYLKDEPLEARPDSLGYRTGKFIRRNRRALSAATLAILVITTMALFFTVRLAQARNAALSAAARTQRVQRFILNLFEGNDKSAGPAEGLRVVTLVDRGLKEAQTLRGDPEMHADLYQTLGGIYQKLGNFSRAESLLDEALKERTARLGPGHPEVAQSLIELGLLRADQAHFDDAERLVRRGLETIRAARPGDDRPLAQATASLGNVLTARGSYVKAIPVLEEAARLESHAGSETLERAAILKELAIAEFYLSHYETSEALSRRVLAMDRRLFGERHPGIADDLINLGAVQFERGHYVESEQFDRQALAIMRAWYGAGHPETASTMFMLSKTLVEQKKFDEAVQLLQQADAIQERVYGPVHPRVANILNELGFIAYVRNRPDEAKTQYERVVRIYRAAYGDRNDRVALALGNLGSVYASMKEYGRAEQLLRDVLDRYHQTLPADHVNIGIAQVKLGDALLHEKKYREALSTTVAGYQLTLKKLGPANKWTADARKNLVEEYEALKQPDQAQHYREELNPRAK